jgi:beta-lactamase regulating signal transducer with metallopeptidase domain
MNAIDTLLRQPAAQVLGWVLLHFVWQGALVGALTAIALAALRRSAADIRYVLSTVALSVMLTLPVVTAVQLWHSVTESHAPATAGVLMSGPSARSTAVAEARVSAGLPASGSSEARARALNIEPWLPACVLIWTCGVAILSLRLVSGWLWVQRMKSHGTTKAGSAWEQLAERVSRRLHISRRVRLLQSTVVDVPTVIGWIKPVILLPASALSGLSPHQLEAILAHELAHIRRHDYLVNLLQSLVETLLFYHPAVWWLSRRIRAERENCCDDLAVSLSGDPYTYAKALADLEALRGARPYLVMAADGGSLVNRIRRLLGAPTHAGRAPGWLAGTVSVAVMLGIAVGALGTDAFEAAQGATSTRSTTRSTDSQAQPLRRDASPTVRQLRDEAEDVSAAAAQMARRAGILDEAARAATALQKVTRQATTPVVAGQTLDARAAALRENAQRMAAQADAIRAAAVREGSSVATLPLPALAHDEPALASRHLTFAVFRADSAAVLPALARVAPTGAVQKAQRSHGTMTWQNNGERMEVRFDGEAEFSDDDADVTKLSPGGLFRIKEGGIFGGFFASHTVEISADNAGRITRRFWSGMSEQPFEPEGRQWLARTLPRFIRQTGYGARARVARIFKARGAAGVLAEVSLIDGSWGKKTYLSELLKIDALDAPTIRQVLTLAGREIDSDFELASLLLDSADRVLANEGTRQAYFEASRTIGSDFEMARVYKGALKRGPASPPVLAAILVASREIDSDFEQASLLVEIARLQPLDGATRKPFFDALGTVASDFERGRVLKALSARSDLSADTTAAMSAAATSMNSDFEAASFLVDLVKQYPIEGPLRTPFFGAVESIDSSFERGRVLQAVVRRPDVSDETILSVVRAVAAMGSSFEASQVLLAVAGAHSVAGPARDAYINAAEKLGDFEQGRVLAALVKSERRR